MSSSKKEPIILTKENSNNQIIEITAYHLQDLSAVEKAPNLCKLNFIGGELKNFQSLEKCSLFFVTMKSPQLLLNVNSTLAI